MISLQKIYSYERLFSLNSCFLTNNIYSQDISLVWQHCYGGTWDDEVGSIRQTPDGGYIVAGFSESDDGDITAHINLEDYWIVKLNSSGILEWEKSFGGYWSENISSIELTPDGGYILAGRSASSDGDVSFNHGEYDFWIVKLDELANIVWEKSYGGTFGDHAESIQITTDGGYIVVGSSFSNDGDLSENKGLSDGWALKINENGAVEWEISLGGSHYDEFRSVRQTNDGDYVIVGNTYSNDGDILSNHGGYDLWFVKLNATGEVILNKTMGGTSHEGGLSIQEMADGSSILAGYSQSIDGDVSINNGYEDFWIVKVDINGDILWEKSYGGSGLEMAVSIVKTIDDGFVVGGISESNDGDVTQNYGRYDYWVIKLNNIGELEWEKSIGGVDWDTPKSVIQNNEGNYVIAGSSWSPCPGRGYYNFSIVELTESPLGLTEFTSGDFNINPNPVKDVLTVNSKDAVDFLKIFSTNGKLLKETTASSINVSELASGLYFVVVSIDGRNDTKKFIKI